MPIYKSDGENSDKELEFELNYQASLSTAERFQMMFDKSRQISELLQKNGHRKAFKIIKRI